jgi:hypothetical protein
MYIKFGLKSKEKRSLRIYICIYIHTYIVTIYGCVTIDGEWIGEWIY